MTIPINPVFAQALASAQDKFGRQNVYNADEHRQSIFGIPVPIAVGYLTGGSSVMPLRRVVGIDGVSGSYKSCLMMEFARHTLAAGGLVVIVDTEEKVSDTMVCGMLFREDPAVRLNYAYAKAGSVEQAQEFILHFKASAKAQVASVEDVSGIVPWFVIWDSLTGRDTKGAKEKLEKEGSAAVRAFAEAANSIARFYKGLAFGDELMTLAHVQHVGHNMDPDAKGDEEWKAKGGDEPRYAASFHLRVTSVKAISSAAWEGKELTIKCVKSSLGPDKRRLRARVLWKYVWIDQPIFEGTGEDREILANKEAQMTLAEAQTYYDWTQQSLSGRDAFMLREFLQLDKKQKKDADPAAPHCYWPQTNRIRFQQTWWDWDWALGNLLVHEIKYNDDTSAQEKRDLEETLHFVKGANNNAVKCEELFGDSEPRTLEEFGRAIAAHPEISKRVSTFLCITPYKDYREAEITVGGVKKKRGKKGG